MVDMIIVFWVFSRAISHVLLIMMIDGIIYKISVLKNKRAIAIYLNTALSVFYASLPTRIIKQIKLYWLCVIVLLTHETKANKFSASFNFFVKWRSLPIVKIPFIVIKPETSFKGDFVAKIVLVVGFWRFDICSYLRC